MSGLIRFWDSTIGKKIVMAATGIVGVLFVIGHMSGNLLMFKGQDAIHHYAVLLRTSMPFLYFVRTVLVASVALHIIAAYQLTRRANAARPTGYVNRAPQVTTLAARTIRWGGVLLLAFIVIHILQITLGVSFLIPSFTHLDPYTNLRTAFANPAWVVFYLLAMAALALHLYHGTWSVVRTLGVARPSREPLKRRVSIVIAILVAAGFALIPLAAVFGAFPAAPPLESSATAALNGGTR